MKNPTYEFNYLKEEAYLYTIILECFWHRKSYDLHLTVLPILHSHKKACKWAEKHETISFHMRQQLKMEFLCCFRYRLLNALVLRGEYLWGNAFALQDWINLTAPPGRSCLPLGWSVGRFVNSKISNLKTHVFL